MSVIPVVERIADAIFARLQELEAGFWPGIEPPSVIRSTNHIEDPPEHYQIVLTMGERTRTPELDGPGNPCSNAFRQQFNIRCRLMPSENDNTPIDEYRNNMEAAVRSVLCFPQNSWHTWGSLAFNSEFETVEHVGPGGSFAGITIPLMVSYRVSEDDLCEVRA